MMTQSLPLDNALWGWYNGRYTYHEPRICGGDGWYMQLNPTWLVTGYLVVGMVAENAGVQRYSISVWEMPQFSDGDTASWALLPLVERIEHARDEDYYALCNKYDPWATTRASWRGTLADRLCGRRREQERLDRIMDYCHGLRDDAVQAHTALRLGEDDYRALNCAMDLGWGGA